MMQTGNDWVYSIIWNNTQNKICLFRGSPEFDILYKTLKLRDFFEVL